MDKKSNKRKVSAREDSILFLSDSADKEAKTLSNFCEIEGIINTSLPVPDAILAEVLRHVAGFEDEKDRKKAGQSVLVCKAFYEVLKRLRLPIVHFEGNVENLADMVKKESEQAGAFGVSSVKVTDTGSKSLDLEELMILRKCPDLQHARHLWFD